MVEIFPICFLLLLATVMAGFVRVRFGLGSDLSEPLSSLALSRRSFAFLPSVVRTSADGCFGRGSSDGGVESTRNEICAWLHDDWNDERRPPSWVLSSLPGSGDDFSSWSFSRRFSPGRFFARIPHLLGSLALERFFLGNRFFPSFLLLFCSRWIWKNILFSKPNTPR